MKKRKPHSLGFKNKMVLKVLQERETDQEIGRKYDIHPSQISTWKSQFLAGASTVFEKGVSKTEDDKEKDALFKKVVQLQLENDFFKKSIWEIAKSELMIALQVIPTDGTARYGTTSKHQQTA